jgi:glycosyltransferase involved in cell wall biosynthesis
MTRATAPTLLFLVTEDWFFCSHFLGLIEAARLAGFDPVVATRVTAHGDRIVQAGARLVPVAAERRALGPTALFDLLLAYHAVLRRERPAVVHCIALKPVVFGGLAARLAGGSGLVLAPTGLGATWIAKGIAARLSRAAIQMMIGWLARAPETRFVFENRDDPRALGVDSAAGDRITIVSGAGVAADLFPPLPPPEPAAPLRVAVVARMVESKGIADAVEAVRRVREAGHDVELDLWGASDPDNPRPLTTEQLTAWGRLPGICWRGRTDDVAAIWRRSHVAMLLSHGGEGLPRTLVEAAACARPIVTTDVPGCRDVVQGGAGILVPPCDPAAAASALVRLVRDPGLCAAMGAAARARFEQDMTQDEVCTRIETVYRTFAARGQ